jgi:hypothetical protein
MIRLSLAGALGALLLTTAAASGDVTANFPGIDKLPAGYRAIDGFSAFEGIPYALGDQTGLPTPPIYWVYKDKVIGFEVVMDQKQIDRHESQKGIEPIPGLPPVDHLELIHSDGHDWFITSTWSIRVDFVSDDYRLHMMMN